MGGKMRTLSSGVTRPVLVATLAAFILCANLAPFNAAAEGDWTVPKTYRKVIVGLVADPPFTMKNERGQWTGFHTDLWRYIAADLGLSYEFKELTFKGIQDALRDGTIDVSIAALYETSDRYRLYDFSTTVGSSRMAVAVGAEKESHPFVDAMRIFFSWSVLTLLALFIAILFGLGVLIWRIERNHNPDHFGGRPAKGIGTGAYWVSSALAAGACLDIDLKSLPGRLIGLVWIFIGALAFSAFTASLASTLISNRQTVETYNAHKLKSLRLGVLRDSLQHTLAKQIGGKYVVYDYEKDLLPALREKKIDGVFIGEISLNYHVSRELDSPLKIHPTEFKPRRFAFAFPKGSPLRRPVNLALTQIMEKPEWEALALRYGLDNNLEPKRMALGKRSRIAK